jgi:hypothetical protein
MVHRLKWEHQPERRSNNWRATIEVQQQDLEDLLESGTLRRYAREVLSTAYERAVRQAALETGLAESEFPTQSTWSLEKWMSKEGL